jgi:hypothetical protein
MELQHTEIYTGILSLLCAFVFQYLTLTCHFDARNNATEWMFNAVTMVWYYDLQAHKRIPSLHARYSMI